MVREHISLGISVSLVRETHITRNKCFPGRGTNITRDMCFPGRGTHITRDMCFPGRGTHITRNTCFPGRGKHITRHKCSLVGKHISLRISVSLLGEGYVFPR